MAFKFENLRVWQKSIDFTVEIYELSKTLPSDERFNLISQINRAADSIALNIAEGSTGQTDKQFAVFLGYAQRSGIEVVSCLHILLRKQMIYRDDFDKFYELATELIKMIQALKKNTQKINNPAIDHRPNAMDN